MTYSKVTQTDVIYLKPEIKIKFKKLSILDDMVIVTSF